jgi:hypothetical protein
MTDTSSGFERTTLATCMVGGAIGLLASAVVSPSVSNDAANRLAGIAANPARGYLFVLFGIIGTALWMPPTLRLGNLLRDRARNLGRAGAALTFASLALALVDYGTELMKWDAARSSVSRAATAKLIDGLDHDAGVTILLQLSGLLFLAGILLLTLGARRAGLVRAWVILALLGGAALNLAGFATASRWLLITSGLVLVLASAPLARALAHGTPPGSPETRARTAPVSQPV